MRIQGRRYSNGCLMKESKCLLNKSLSLLPLQLLALYGLPEEI